MKNKPLSFLAFGLLFLFILSAEAQNQQRIDSLQRLLDAASADTTRVNYLVQLSTEYRLNDFEKALAYATQALEESKRVNYQFGQASSLNSIGAIYLDRGDYQVAKNYLKESLEKYKEIKSDFGAAQAAGNLGILYHYQGFNDTAEVLVSQSISLLSGMNTSKSKIALTSSINTLGEIYRSTGKFDEALIQYRKALQVSEETKVKSTLISPLGNISAVFLAKGEPDSALYYANKSLTVAEETFDRVAMANSLRSVTSVYISMGNYPQALNYILKAAKLYEELGNSRSQGMMLMNAGLIYYLQKDFKHAVEYIDQALVIARKNGNRDQIAYCLNILALAQSELRQYDAAIANIVEGIQIIEKLGPPNEVSNFLNSAGMIYNKAGKYKEALDISLKALDISAREGYKELNSNNSNQVGNAYFGLHNYPRAIFYQTQSLQIAKEINSLKLINRSSEGLAKAYAAVGNYEKAYELELLFKQTNDSIFNSDNTKKMTQLQMQYDFDKQQAEQKAEQDKKDTLTAATLKSQNIIRNISLAGLALAILVTILLFNQYRTIRKSKHLLEEKNKIIEQEKNRAEQSEQFKSRFLANMSHEIRTPMNAVMGMTNLVLNSNLDEQQAKYMNAIRKSSQNLLVIINDILDLSKIEAGKMELEKTDFRLSDVLDNINDTLRFRAEEKSLKLAIEVADDTPKVLKGDPARLNQILINLVGNAIKFTEKGAVTLGVSCYPERSRRTTGELPPNGSNSLTMIQLQFEVKDTGIGIPVDKVDKVFEGFSQADKATFRKFGGTGLGLNITKQLVELHGGTISVASTEGKGTTFIVSVPYEIGIESNVEEKRKTIDAAMISKMDGKKLLLAEDNYFNQVVLIDTLKIRVPRIQVDVAENGKQALEMIQRNHYDLVFMDVHMPEMNGLEAVKIIRELPPPLNHLKIVAMTASITKEEIENCYKAGMDDYVPKPFEQDELLEKIAKLTIT